MTKQLGPAEKVRNALGARRRAEAVYIMLRTAGISEKTNYARINLVFMLNLLVRYMSVAL